MAYLICNGLFFMPPGAENGPQKRETGKPNFSQGILSPHFSPIERAFSPYLGVWVRIPEASPDAGMGPAGTVGVPPNAAFCGRSVISDSPSARGAKDNRPGLRLPGALFRPTGPDLPYRHRYRYRYREFSIAIPIAIGIYKYAPGGPRGPPTKFSASRARTRKPYTFHENYAALGDTPPFPVYCRPVWILSPGP